MAPTRAGMRLEVQHLMYCPFSPSIGCFVDLIVVRLVMPDHVHLFLALPTLWPRNSPKWELSKGWMTTVNRIIGNIVKVTILVDITVGISLLSPIFKEYETNNWHSITATFSISSKVLAITTSFSVSQSVLSVMAVEWYILFWLQELLACWWFHSCTYSQIVYHVCKPIWRPILLEMGMILCGGLKRTLTISGCAIR